MRHPVLKYFDATKCLHSILGSDYFDIAKPDVLLPTNEIRKDPKHTNLTMKNSVTLSLLDDKVE